MNIAPNQVDRLNELLTDKGLDIPDFRRTVGKNGSNYQWLQKHIRARNENLSAEILSLLELDPL